MERYESYYRSLYAMALVVNSSLEPATVLGTITEQTAKAMQAKGCTIRLLDRTGKRLLQSAAYGLSKDYMRKGPVDLDHSEVDREILSGKAIRVADAATDPRFQYGEAARVEGIASVLAVPLVVDGAAIGVLRVYSASAREFDASEEEFLRAIAALSAIAIENARLHQALKKDYEMLASFEYRVFED
ncbi:putative phytochrome sensor protein [Alkalidesulfovibrio alkalitolerans DSM 16529]|jgi:signal transduction protein with GAF and PtsI domain|uniref:Putative phytochrome sensor protein n=1 Tax=Alkalidesulfovibrio alkalitolerans DSM 16529 TaxID=1121439 RepID=S7UN53_9BACT|nr:GAF domain-containing protein [Alkalidesulfovibrio alkalitolerans]EPR35424.1 putative phytochrome sensor protein [Alkalidesulfovibrio alkalitolerans DSM 16529]